MSTDEDDNEIKADEIVSDIIELIQTTTKTSYILSSNLSTKLFNYFDRINLADANSLWNNLNSAVERFEHDSNHPDIVCFESLINTLSCCANDCEERNYTLGRDSSTLADSITQLNELLVAHVNLQCFLLTKSIEEHQTQLSDIMHLCAMNISSKLHGMICNIIYLLCRINRKFSLLVIDHPISADCVRIITNTKDDDTAIICAFRLLTHLLMLDELFPVQTFVQLSDPAFLKHICCLIEKSVNSRKSDGNFENDNESLILNSIKFLLALNLKFDYPSENPLMLMMQTNDQSIFRELLERLILLLNRNVDLLPNSISKQNSIIKFFTDVFSATTISDHLLYESDRRLIVEIISRELNDRSCADDTTTHLLSLLELILRNGVITKENCTRTEDLRTCLITYLQSENCLEHNRFIIEEISRHNGWLTISDTDN